MKSKVKSITCYLMTSRSLLSGIFLSALLIGCDMFKADDASKDAPVVLSQKSILMTQKSSGIIDLQSLIRTSGTLKMAVTTPPTQGSLQSLGKDLLQYTPNIGFRQGRDKFIVSVFSASNTIVTQDSIVIIVRKDSTSAPGGCAYGLYIQNDYVYNVKGAIELDVLSNDDVCGVARKDLTVSIADITQDGNPVSKSYFGSVAVLAGGNIRYTPGPDFQGKDKFVYRVDKPANLPRPGDAATSAFGFVYLTGFVSCKDSLILRNDTYSFKLDTINKKDTLYLNTAANDVLCLRALNSFSFGFDTFPKGKLFYGRNYGFNYLVPADAQPGSTDKFTYSLCVDDVCKSAEVSINFK